MKNNKFTLAVVTVLFASVSFGSMAFAKEEKTSVKEMPAKEVAHECKKDTTVLTAKDEADCTHQGGKWEEKKAH
jgi:hypothetical protein